MIDVIAGIIVFVGLVLPILIILWSAAILMFKDWWKGRL